MEGNKPLESGLSDVAINEVAYDDLSFGIEYFGSTSLPFLQILKLYQF